MNRQPLLGLYHSAAVLGGVFAIRFRFGKPFSAFTIIMTAGLTLLSFFYVSEAYFPQIPGGLLFMAPGLMIKIRVRRMGIVNITGISVN